MNWLQSDETYPEVVCVKIVAHIRENATGDVRKYQTWAIYEPDDGPYPSVFNWEENNYRCDCNRALFFGYANGLKYEDMEDRECGETAFAVNLENPKTGEIFYREFE